MSPTTSRQAAAQGWDYFPLVMCVNPLDRPWRFEEAKNEFKRAGLSRVVFYQSPKQPDPRKDVIDSHMACLRYAADAHAPFVLVFEDDVLFQGDIAANLGRTIEFLQARPRWKMFYLGGFVFRESQRCTPHILQGAVLTTHAYAIQTGFARQLLRKRPFCSEMSVDLFYSSVINDDAYVHVNPLMCVQRPSIQAGTGDKRAWLGKAMTHTALDAKERSTFKKLSILERLRIQNGIAFFKIHRYLLRRRLMKAESRITKTGDPSPPAPPLGKFTTEELV